MQTNMNYDQFVTAARNAGLYDQFSTADLNLARQNPDAGMQILNYKVDYRNATTDEQRAMAQSGAEGVRSQYGGYSGGADGSGFYKTGSTPTASSFAYTSDGVLQAAKDGGVYSQLSPEDMQLIQSSPDYGMGVVSGKMWVANATTDEEKAYGRNMAEQSRMLGGGYTTNPDGTGYYKMGPSPDDYKAAEAPQYANNYAGDIADLWSKQKNYGDFSYDVEKPTFESQYSDEMQSLMADILNREAFSYDAASDPLYSQYRKQYLREGQRASADALGAAAAATGGIPSSYAATAAAQAGNYYAAQLTDKIPELYQLAYNQYMNDHQMKLSDLSAVGAMDDRDYSRYMDDMSQWNTDRNFAYGVYGDKYNRLADQLQMARDLENTEYGRYLDDMTQYNKDREFGYKQHTDEVDYQTKEQEKALEEAIRQQEYKDAQEEKAYQRAWDEDEKTYQRAWNERAYTDGRTDALWQQGFAEKELSNSMSVAEWEKIYNLAVLQAEAGNTELLNLLGQKMTGENWNTLDASVFQSTGGSGGGNSGSGGGSGSGSGDGDAGDGGGVTPTFSFTGDIRNTYPSGYINNEDYEALAERYGEDQLAAAGVTKGEAPYKTYDEAVKYLKDNGKSDVAHYISPRSEWERHKGGHISYEKYLEARVNSLMGE